MAEPRRSAAIYRLSTEELMELSSKSKTEAEELLSNLRMMTAELRLRLDEAKGERR